MDRIWALIDGQGRPRDLILADEEFALSLVDAIHDDDLATSRHMDPVVQVVEVTDMDPRPNSEWRYLEGQWVAPPPSEPAPPVPDAPEE